MKSFYLRTFTVMTLIWIIVRGGIYLLPGDPAEFLAHESLVSVPPAQIRQSMNLDQSFHQRIFSLPRTESLINHIPTSELLIPALQKTFTLTLLSFIFASLITIGLLYLSFSRENLTPLLYRFTTFSGSLPLSVLGPLLILAFCVQIPVFPLTQSPWLPSLCLAFYLSAFWFRSIHKKMIRFIPNSSVLGARARGASEFNVFLNHLFIPLLGSIASFLGTQFGNLLSGSVLVEVIFQWNGVGSLLLKSVHQRDYPIIEATLIVTSLFTVLSQHLGYWFQKKIGAST